MDKNQRFALLTLPQFFDGNVLAINLAFLPRNQNPLTAAIVGAAPIPEAPAFADASLSFVARIVSGQVGMPGSAPALPPIPLPIAVPVNTRELFEALAEQFSIGNKSAVNNDANVNQVGKVAPVPRAYVQSVKKYLPETYRKSFNFVAPRTSNAVTDDGYRCAVRNATNNPAFVRSNDEISWGQVFSSALRQPKLATALGMIYQTQITIDAAHFPKGGWLYVELADASDYKAQLTADTTFIKSYAARIPPLTIGVERNVYGAIQFPVAAPTPLANYDELFRESADYDDGFARIVHAFQAQSSDLLQEQGDGAHPTHDIGVRLGWDDEQILLWYIRQLAADPDAGRRIDAPISTFGYKIDVREHNVPADAWNSLNQVSSDALTITNPLTHQAIEVGDDSACELPYQVYPSQLGGDASQPFWLPMYFAAWAGKSMVLPDTDASRLYQHGDAKPRTEINVGGPPANRLNRLYEPAPIAAPLRYGHTYEFRIRLSDLSGGGPLLKHVPEAPTPSQIATCHFRRFVAPDVLRIDGLPANTDEIVFNDPKLTMRRPLLGYPAVVFTGRYADPIAKLQQASNTMKGVAAFGIDDPDVSDVEITVELQSLGMDNLQSVSGRDSYIHFYTTKRKFPNASAVFEDELSIALTYKDCKVLRFADPADLGDLGVAQAELDVMDELILPRARTIRLTIRAVCERKPGYFGLEKADTQFNTRYGRTVQLKLRADALEDELELLNPPPAVRGIFLQPDPPFVFDGSGTSLLLGKVVERIPDIAQRLAQQLGVESRGLTLVAKRGERMQFGCSQRIRHTLAPDNSSITFASKGDLAQHWLCCVQATVQRDWTWDGLEDRSFVLERSMHFREDDGATEVETLEVGDIELRKTAPIGALSDADRSHTKLVFIDAVEPNNLRLRPAPHAGEPRLPDLIEVTYTMRPAYKRLQGAATDGEYVMSVTLPITTPPAQVPRVVSAGIALSPYVAGEKYAETQQRRRVLWIEFAEPVHDTKDTYFARDVCGAPDQLISNNSPGLLVAPEERPLLIDAEYIRVIDQNQPVDDAGLDGMKPMTKATGPDKDADRFYLLPLPEGLHPESPELFGFFTYELRVGHYRYSDDSPHHAKGDPVWTSAQGRYGRPLGVQGIQHPAPTLACVVDRDNDKLYVSAPYAVAVQDGKDVTADPPRTMLWALLYAQVKQVDNSEYRNVLLDDRMLSAEVQVEHRRQVNWAKSYTVEQRNSLKIAALRNFNGGVAHAGLAEMFKPAASSTVNQDATKSGTAVWATDEVTQLLKNYGLTADSPLSVLCVEVLPHITNVRDHVSSLHKNEVREGMRTVMGGVPAMEDAATKASISFDEPRPMTNDLGNYRILRTSPLTKVPYVC
jgi:hypothetical protein